MKHLLLALLLIGLMLQNFSKHLIMLEFRVNRDYIAKVLCVNRNKPQMHCDGKCHLKKQLETDDQPQKNRSNSHDGYEVIFVNGLPAFQLEPFADSITHTAFYRDPKSFATCFACFHPPQA